MENSNDHRRLREMLEVSRSGDLAAYPDLARALADDSQARLALNRIQSWDAAIGAAMDRVELPAGLEQRILARLASVPTLDANPTLAGSVAAAVDPANAPSGDSGTEVSLAPKPAARSIRPLTYWSGVGVAAITAAVLVIAADYWLKMGSEVAIDQLAQQWQEKLSGDWQPLDGAPAEFPFPEAMRVAATGWQWIGKRTPTPVVAYHLTDGKTTALLYAAQMTREGLPASPPKVPQQDTGGQAIAYWRSPRTSGPQKSDLVYVLVMQDSKLYPAFVRRASTPLAILLPLRFNTLPAREVRPLVLPRKIA